MRQRRKKGGKKLSREVTDAGLEKEACPSCDSTYIWKSKRTGRYKCYGCEEKFSVAKRRRIKETVVKKRDPKQLPMISRQQLLSLIQRCKSRRDAAMITALYLSGARISELLELRADQFNVGEIKKEQFLAIKNIRTAKRRHGQKEYRDIYVHYGSEKEFVDILVGYINTCWEKERPFNFTRQRADQIIKINTEGKIDLPGMEKGLTCHYLRHMRNTDMLNIYPHIRIEDLQVFNGWKDLRAGSFYVHRSGRDVARKLASGSDE